MHDYAAPTEVVRMVLALGIIISMLVYERWRLTGGAAVVAGYLGLFVNRPLYILTTVGLAVVTFYIVDRLIARRMFLYGRRRVVVMVIIGLFLQLLTGVIAYFLQNDAAWLTGLYGVGYVLPGLIAQDIERQGASKTVLTVLVVSFLTFLMFKDVVAIKANMPIYWSSIAFEDKTIYYSYHTKLLTVAVVFSVLVSAVFFEWTGIRSGGFLTAAYAALFVLKPQHLIFIILVGMLVYYFVTHFLMRKTPIFGRTKFAMMVLTGLVFTWALEYLSGVLTQNVFIPFAGFSVISPMIAALIANDGERQGLGKTILGVLVCTLVVFTAVKGIDLFFIG
jgi:poly-gamma-glutamate biosynthesis protein PgsC/CapC